MRSIVFALSLFVVPVFLGTAAHAGPASVPDKPAAVASAQAEVSEPSLASDKKRNAVIATAVMQAAKLKKIDSPFFLPLVHPGMVGRYDIMGWHSKKASGPVQ